MRKGPNNWCLVCWKAGLMESMADSGKIAPRAQGSRAMKARYWEICAGSMGFWEGRRQKADFRFQILDFRFQISRIRGQTQNCTIKRPGSIHGSKRLVRNELEQVAE